MAIGSHAGILTADGHPPPRDAVRQLTESLRRGEGRAQSAAERACVVCYRGSDDPVSGGARFHRSPSGIMAALDGQLFERQSTAACVLGEGARHASDAAIVTAAYEKWGARCFERLHGEWSAAVYDPSASTLTLASDYSGAVPLYYSTGPSGTTWSSELTGYMVERSGARINPDYIVGFIWRAPAAGLTPFKDVQAVPPGHVVQIRNGTSRVIRGWCPDLHARIRYSRDEDYEEHFRDVFSRVVRDRLTGGVWCELSGGLDSSGIVCVASRLVREQDGGGVRLRTVSYDFAGGDSDEDRMCRADLNRATGLPNVSIDTSSIRLIALDRSTATPFPAYADGIIPRVARLMQESNAQRLLSGEGGDATMWAQGKWGPCLTLHEQLRDGEWKGWPGALQRFGEWTRRSLWDIVRHDVISCARWERRRQPRVLPAWLIRDPVIHALERAPADRDCDGAATCRPTVRIAFRAIERARGHLAGGSERLTSNIDVSYPYLDRRLVQFMLAVPFAQKLRPGEARSLQRRALEGIIPESVRTRSSKGRGIGSLMHTLRSEWPGVRTLLADDSRLAQMGIVHVGRLREDATAARSGLKIPFSSAMWSAIVAEMWIRQQEGAAREGFVSAAV